MPPASSLGQVSSYLFSIVDWIANYGYDTVLVINYCHLRQESLLLFITADGAYQGNSAHTIEEQALNWGGWIKVLGLS